MNALPEPTAHQVYEWYADIELRLKELVRVLPFVRASELREIRSPRLASILLESASLVDTLLRHHLPTTFFQANGKRKSRHRATIQDYREQLDATLKLSTAKTLLLLGVPSLLTPFKEWQNQPADIPEWWRKYNELKHDRLASAQATTLLDCLLSTCALNQVMTKLPSVRKFVFRFGWSQLAGYNPQVALQDLETDCPMSYVAYTDFFATFLTNVGYGSVDDIRPIMFRNNERLQAHLGRIATRRECE